MGELKYNSAHSWVIPTSLLDRWLYELSPRDFKPAMVLARFFFTPVGEAGGWVCLQDLLDATGMPEHELEESLEHLLRSEVIESDKDGECRHGNRRLVFILNRDTDYSGR